MRALVTIVAVLSFALLGACTKSISDTDYAREGIGVDLSRSALPSQTELQNIYLANLCQQASDVLVTIECTAIAPNQWPLVVQAGMNDIDLRCDAYLTWIDNVRRSSVAALQEITDVGTATEAIMGVTGVSAKQIAIVGTAFGLAYNTFTNVSHRLILDVDKTTVQSVVYHRRSDFRNDLARQPPVDNRPAAIHALRQYLSICLPITIETDINATVTTFQRTGGTGAGPVDVTTVRAATQAGNQRPPQRIVSTTTITNTKQFTQDEAIGNAANPIEANIKIDRGKSLQATLCEPQTGDFGAAGLTTNIPPTRAALREFNTAVFYGSDPMPAIPDTIATSKLRDALFKANKGYPSCTGAGFTSAFEVGIFSTQGFQAVRSAIATAVSKRLGQTPSPTLATGGPKVDGDLRTAIAALRVKFDGGAAQLDYTFYDWIAKAGSRN